jgi:hypothetical protein
MTVSQRICMRLRVPCTPSELAAIFGKPLRLIRAFLYQLRRQHRVERTQRIVRKPDRTRGRPYEYLWIARATA